jgi:hypothetical protein
MQTIESQRLITDFAADCVPNRLFNNRLLPRLWYPVKMRDANKQARELGSLNRKRYQNFPSRVDHIRAAKTCKSANMHARASEPNC